VLLSNPAVQAKLEKRFVMAWESVGSVPKVTIDFGNGKKMERTLGGNSLFTVLLPNGRVVDALPGVYTPEDFLRNIQGIENVLSRSGGLDGVELNPKMIYSYHKELSGYGQGRKISVSKRGVESPLLGRLVVGMPDDRLAFVQQEKNLIVRSIPLLSKSPLKPRPLPVIPEELKELANLEAEFEKASARIVDVSKIPGAAVETGTIGSQAVKSPEMAGQEAVVRDSVTNQQLTRPVVHLYLASLGEYLPEMANCRDVIYERVLHTPLNDPYLGLRNVLLPGTK
jgi:hypothetical protein